MASDPATEAVNVSPGRTFEMDNELSSRTVMSVPAGRLRACEGERKGVALRDLGSGGSAGWGLSSAVRSGVWWNGSFCSPAGEFAPASSWCAMLGRAQPEVTPIARQSKSAGKLGSGLARRPSMLNMVARSLSDMLVASEIPEWH
jgi:hypothetical protein